RPGRPPRKKTPIGASFRIRSWLRSSEGADCIRNENRGRRRGIPARRRSESEPRLVDFEAQRLEEPLRQRIAGVLAEGALELRQRLGGLSPRGPQPAQVQIREM